VIQTLEGPVPRLFRAWESWFEKRLQIDPSPPRLPRPQRSGRGWSGFRPIPRVDIAPGRLDMETRCGAHRRLAKTWAIGCLPYQPKALGSETSPTCSVPSLASSVPRRCCWNTAKCRDSGTRRTWDVLEWTSDVFSFFFFLWLGVQYVSGGESAPPGHRGPRAPEETRTDPRPLLGYCAPPEVCLSCLSPRDHTKRQGAALTNQTPVGKIGRPLVYVTAGIAGVGYEGTGRPLPWSRTQR